MGISKNFLNVSVDFLCNYKKNFFPGHFEYKLENQKMYTEKYSFYHFTGSETC